MWNKKYIFLLASQSALIVGTLSPVNMWHYNINQQMVNIGGSRPDPVISAHRMKEIAAAAPTLPAIALLLGACSSAVISGDGFPYVTF